MKALSIAVLVIFMMVCVLMTLLIAAQDENNDGIGGIFGMNGQSGSTFGAQTSSIITKITSGFVVVFFVLALVLGFLNTSKSKDTITEKAISEAQESKESDVKTDWWKLNESSTSDKNSVDSKKE